jgi:hypothetical protein
VDVTKKGAAQSSCMSGTHYADTASVDPNVLLNLMYLSVLPSNLTTIFTIDLTTIVKINSSVSVDVSYV